MSVVRVLFVPLWFLIQFLKCWGRSMLWWRYFSFTLFFVADVLLCRNTACFWLISVEEGTSHCDDTDGLISLMSVCGIAVTLSQFDLLRGRCSHKKCSASRSFSRESSGTGSSAKRFVNNPSILPLRTSINPLLPTLSFCFSKPCRKTYWNFILSTSSYQKTSGVCESTVTLHIQFDFNPSPTHALR